MPSAEAGAVKVGCATSVAKSSTSSPPGWVHEYLTFEPHGSSWPFSAPATPSSTSVPAAASRPSPGPAFASGRKRALPGLNPRTNWFSFSSFSNSRGGRLARPLPDRFRIVSLVSSSNSPAGKEVRPPPTAWWLPFSDSCVRPVSGPNTPAGMSRRRLPLRRSTVTPDRLSKSPAFSPVIVLPVIEERRSSVP